MHNNLLDELYIQLACMHRVTEKIKHSIFIKMSVQILI